MFGRYSTTESWTPWFHLNGDFSLQSNESFVEWMVHVCKPFVGHETLQKRRVTQQPEWHRSNTRQVQLEINAIQLKPSQRATCSGKRCHSPCLISHGLNIIWVEMATQNRFFHFSKLIRKWFGGKIYMLRRFRTTECFRVAETHCTHAACTMMWSLASITEKHTGILFQQTVHRQATFSKMGMDVRTALWLSVMASETWTKEQVQRELLDNPASWQSVIFHKVGTEQCHHTGWSGSTGQHGEQ